MNREEFFTKAVIEIAASMSTQSGAWKFQMDRAIELAQYLTTQVYGEYSPTDGPTLPL